MSGKKRIHIFVSGRVQGVFFRDSARNKAKELGVFGWVSNLPGRRVEAVLEGEEAAVDALSGWFKKGPRWARVEKIEEISEDYKGEFKSFEIKRNADR
jgi:acylphosphatase